MPRKDLFPKTPVEFSAWQDGARRRHRERAIAIFCHLYRPVILQVLRSRQIQGEEAEDLAQAFLLYFIRSNAIARLDRSKGRFRDFLTGALNHYLSGLRKRHAAVKRGGDHIFVSLDERFDEAAALRKAATRTTRGDRVWADRLLASVADQLGRQYAEEGRWEMFRVLQPHLSGEEPPPYEDLAARVRREIVTLRSDVKRLRQRFRDALREELRKRVGPERIDAELDALRAILRGE
jgi:RNA polymerase sigma-70 factor (ECF subfamily)